MLLQRNRRWPCSIHAQGVIGTACLTAFRASRRSAQYRRRVMGESWISPYTDFYVGGLREACLPFRLRSKQTTALTITLPPLHSRRGVSTTVTMGVPLARRAILLAKLRGGRHYS